MSPLLRAEASVDAQPVGDRELVLSEEGVTPDLRVLRTYGRHVDSVIVDVAIRVGSATVEYKRLTELRDRDRAVAVQIVSRVEGGAVRQAIDGADKPIEVGDRRRPELPVDQGPLEMLAAVTPGPRYRPEIDVYCALSGPVYTRFRWSSCWANSKPPLTRWTSTRIGPRRCRLSTGVFPGSPDRTHPLFVRERSHVGGLERNSVARCLVDGEIGNFRVVEIDRTLEHKALPQTLLLPRVVVSSLFAFAYPIVQDGRIRVGIPSERIVEEHG